MSKVLLIAINAKYVHTSLAIKLIAAGIGKNARREHDVINIELTAQIISSSGSEIADSIAGYLPDVVGISAYIWNAGVMPGFMKLLKERMPRAVFVLGGPEAAYNPDYWLGLGADYVLPGEGEYSLPPLLDALEDTRDIRDRLNYAAATTQEKRPLVAPPAPVPCRFEDEPVDAYANTAGELNDRILYIETSRGCPYRCAYCLSADSPVRFVPIETAKSWLLKLSKYGVRTIKLVDRTFNCNASRAYELFEYIIGLETACCFHFEVAADLFDERAISLLGAAVPGRIQLETGIQSFFPPALAAASRQTDTEKAERNIRALVREGNIHMHVDLIAGLPYETLPDFQNSFDRAFALRAHTLQLGFLKLLHGSKLREQANDLGIIYDKDPPYEIVSSPWLSAEDISILKLTENALQHTYNKSRFISTIEYVLSVSGLRPFSFFYELGRAAPNHGAQLKDYASQVFEFCLKAPGVRVDELRDRMVVDLLGMVKGENTPDCLLTYDRRRGKVAEAAKIKLGGGIGRCEAAVLSSGMGVFVDKNISDPVTGLHKVYQVMI